MYIYTFIHIYIYIHIHVYEHIYIYIHMYVCIVYIYIYGAEGGAGEPPPGARTPRTGGLPPTFRIYISHIRIIRFWYERYKSILVST